MINDRRSMCVKAALLGTVSALVLGVPQHAKAAPVCAGFAQFSGGSAEGTIAINQNCEVTAAEQAVTPTESGPLAGSTNTHRLRAIAPNLQITIGQGAGLVNSGNGVLGHAILSGDIFGASVESITNDGFLASDAAPASVIAVDQDTLLTINNGTTAGSTSATAIIKSFDGTGSAAAIFAGGFLGQPVAGGDIVINQGSANSSGSILGSDTATGPAIAVLNTTGNVSINNRSGTIAGGMGVVLGTEGTVSITNGIDASTTGSIVARAASRPAIGVGPIGIPGAPAQTPASLSIVNNVGSSIIANQGNGTGVFVTDLEPGGLNNTVLNRGLIDGTGGFAVQHAPSSTAGAGIHIINEGTMNGEVFLGDDEDLFTFNGGVLSGSILANSGAGNVDVTADSRLNGAIVNSLGAVAGNRGSINIDRSFGTITLRNDSALSVGHDPRNAALNGGVFFSQLSSALATSRPDTGSVNYLFGTQVNQQVGTPRLRLREVNFLSGTSTLLAVPGGYHVGRTTIGNSARLNILADVQIGGSLAVNGVLDLNQNVVTVGDGKRSSTVIFEAGSTLSTQIVGAGPTSGSPNPDASGHVILDGGGVVFRNGAQLSISVAPGVAIADGSRYALVIAANNSARTVDAVVGDVAIQSPGGISWGVLRADSFVFGSTRSHSSEVYLVANAARAATAALAGEGSVGNNDGIFSQFVEFSSPTGRAEGQTLFAELLSIPSREQVQTALTQLSPDTSGGASQGASASQGAASSAVGGRADNVQAALSSELTGVAAGDGSTSQPIGIWGQAFGFNALQDRRRNVEGFSARGGGLVLGVDTEVDSDIVLGGALSYNQTRVDGRGISSNNRTDIDSYQASLYGVLQGDPWFIQAQAGYAIQEFDGRRSVSVGAISERPTAEFDGHVLSAGISAGLPIEFGEYVVTPRTSLDYAYSEQDRYTERNAPTTALVVNENRDESLRSGLGASIATKFSFEDNATLRPELRMNWFHEFQATATNSVASFAFGSTPFTTRGAKPAKDAFNVGTGLTYVDDGVSIDLQYDAEFKDRYISNALVLRSRWTF